MAEKAKRPEGANHAAQGEMDKVQAQFENMDADVKSMTMDRLTSAPKQDVEPQTRMSSRDIAKAPEIYLKPAKTMMAVDPKTGRPNKFNERFRSQYEYDKEYVQFIAENRELIGETIEMWTLPYGGMPAEFWQVPTNKPVWGPRYLAEKIRRCNYRRIVMNSDKMTSADGKGTYYGALEVETVIERLTASPVSSRKSIFMGAGGF